MLLLKNIYNLSDEGVVARWMENPYMQYFTGEKVFQKRPPMNPIDMTKFRKRIGTIGAEKIFKISLLVNAKEITGKEMKLVMIDSTVQVHEPFPHRDIRDINTPNLVPMVNLQPSQKIRHDVNSRSGSTQVLLRIDGLDAHLAHQEAVLKYFELQS